MYANKQEEIDILIIGGGIAGLWIFNRLKQLGYQVILVENQALGGGQTIKAQGIIHGGIKYALKGTLTSEAKALKEMPARWQQCLEGKGEINLSDVQVLSPYHYLWTTGDFRSNITQFLASQVLQSHSLALHRTHYPPIFQHQQFKGRIYQVKENVLAVPSLIRQLAQPYSQHLLKINDLHITGNEGLGGVTIAVNHADPVQIKAKRYIFTAGEFNGSLGQFLPKAPSMQRRPLHMVMAKLPFHYDLYAHCIGVNTAPRLTITTHISASGHSIWYLGGQIAEEGISRNPAQQIAYAQAELATLFPWLDFNNADFASFLIDRAENHCPHQKKPDSIFLAPHDNTLIAWPTKLAFAPLLSDEIIKHLQAQAIQPSHTPLKHLMNWPKAGIALPIWDELFS